MLTLPLTAKWRIATVLMLAVILLMVLASPFNLHAPAAAEGRDPTATVTPKDTSTPTSTPEPAVPTAPSDAETDEAQSAVLFSKVEGEPPPSSDFETIASRLVGIDFGQLAEVTNPPIDPKDSVTGTPPTPQTLVLNLFDDVVFTSIVEHVEPTASGHALWGSIDGVELGAMTLVVNGKVVVGTVRTLDAVYSIRTAGDGAYVIRQNDESSLPPSEPLEPTLTPRDDGDDADDLPPDDGSVIDVMVVYTPLAKRLEGGRAAIEALIDLFVAESNQAYTNSGVIHRIRLVLREEVDYVEDGDSGVDLDRLINSSDGYMDRIHELRDLYTADLVHLLVGSGDVGGTTRRGDAFGLTANASALTFAHELGHNMGLRHDRYASGVPRTGFRYGYVNQRGFEPGAPASARWRTVMAYWDQCTEVGGFNCPRIPYFSNPDKTYNGDPMGVPVDHPSTDVDGPADAVRGLNERREITANFRRSSASPTPRVGLTLSPYWLTESGGTSRLTATLHRLSSEDTTVMVMVSPSHSVTLSGDGTVFIPAGETVSVNDVTITGVDNDDSTGDVIVTVSATVANTSSLGVIEPEPVGLAIADDETTPVVTLSLSPDRVVEGGRGSFATASLDHRSSEETSVTLTASPAEAVDLSGQNQLIIPAGQTVSSNTVGLYPVDDTEFTESEKTATVSGTATNPQRVTGPESVTLTIIDNDGPYFAGDSISYRFTEGIPGTRYLPVADYGNGALTYSISPTPRNGVTFDPGPPARIRTATTAVVADETSYTLVATDADGDVGAMTVNIAIQEGVCLNSPAVSGYADPGTVADCEVLLAFRDLLGGDQTLNWHESLPIFDWQGVTTVDGRVTRIYQRKMGLSGIVPSELGTLSELQYLNLANNKLTGEIPAELNGLANLLVLNLGSNELSGSLTPELGSLTKLQYLRLSGNQLTGTIPTELAKLTNLQHLSLSGNQLAGTIPTELAKLTNLRYLYLSGNQLTSPIPAELGNFANLEELSIDDNELTGPIPADLGNLASLEWLSLSNNRFTGPIPVELRNLTNLEVLILLGNELDGPIPTELAKLANIQHLGLSGNELAGPIPTELAKLTNLLHLDLSSNSLTGPIPAELGNLGRLEDLVLMRNELTGSIPAELSDIASLRRLYLSRNQLTGTIPIELGELSNLNYLELARNQLTGTIPVSLAKLSNLEYLFLSGNELTGCVLATLRDVTYNDLVRLSLPFCDLLLDDLIITQGSIVPAFDPYRTDYVVLTSASRMTVTPVNENGATFRFLDQNRNEIADADGSLDGHQIDLATGVTTIGIVITSQDGQATHTYTIRVADAPSAPTLGTVTPGEGYLTVSWTEPDDIGGPNVESYDIRYIDAAADETIESNWTVVEDVWNVTTGGDLQYAITGLTGETPYDVQVRAENAKGTGPWSETTTGTPATPSNCVSGGAVADATNTGLISDCEALLEGRDTLAGTATLNWSEDTSIAQWEGLRLGGTPQRVTRLEIPGKGLDGMISSELGRLSMLTHLNLRSNDGLTGEIPDELGNLRNLKVLNLHSNSLSGDIPDLSRIAGLEELYLPNNADYDADDSKVPGTGLTGEIPTWLNGMTNMRQLWLWGNSLSGTVPNLSGMTSLDKLKLANNDLTGGVPEASELPPTMTWLIIDRNPFGGTIPDLSGLSRLKLLWLHSNQLTGSVPAGNNYPASLDDLNLRDNMLTGTIPDLSNLDNLTRLRLHNNSLSGEVLATLGGLDSLKQLWLHNEVVKGLGSNMLTSIAAGVGDLADTLIEIELNGNPWADDACVPAALANVAKNDYTDAGIEVCESNEGL